MIYEYITDTCINIFKRFVCCVGKFVASKFVATSVLNVKTPFPSCWWGPSEIETGHCLVNSTQPFLSIILTCNSGFWWFLINLKKALDRSIDIHFLPPVWLNNYYWIMPSNVQISSVFCIFTGHLSTTVSSANGCHHLFHWVLCSVST